jgi:hypothetical protein
MNHPHSDSENPYASPAIPQENRQASDSPNRPDAPLVRPIRISGVISGEDYKAGLKLGMQNAIPRYLVLIFLYLSLILWGLCAYALVRDIDLVLKLAFVTVAFYFIFIVSYKWLIGRQDRHTRNIHKGPFEYEEATITEDGFEAQSQFGQSKNAWQSFGKFEHNDCVAVLHFNGYPRLFRLFPRSKFQTPEDWECFLGLLKRKLGK